MKSSSNVWSACFLAAVLTASVAIPVAAQNQPPAGPDQLAKQAEYMQKISAAEQIVARDESALGRKFDASSRDRIVKALATKSLAEIAATPVGGSPGVLAPGIGDPTDNLVYFPVTPCRVIDTRFIGAGAPIVPGANRNFIVLGGPFDSQGGSATNCNTPFPGPAAAVLNYVAICAPGPGGGVGCNAPGAGGDLRVTPFGSAIPLASAINYIPQNNVANGLVQTTCQGAGCAFDITVQADTTSTHMIADIVGYFMFPTTPVTQDLFAAVNANGTLARGFRVVSTANFAPGDLGGFEVIFDRNVRNCIYVADAGVTDNVTIPPAAFANVNSRDSNVNGVFVQTYNAAGANVAFAFHLHVSCPPAPASP
jgi:hypothetical protein